MRSHRVVVVTGASAGVGRAVARAFAERGYAVGVIARGRDGLEAAAKEIEATGGRAHAVPADVADHRAVEVAADEIEAALGPIGVWVNDAMVSVYALAWDLRPEEVRRVTEVNYLGTVHGTVAALRYMRPRNRGVIVQVGSALAYRGIPLQSAYCGAKHAVQGFTESVRCELLHDRSRVRITMVQLPALNTPQFGWVKSRLPNQPQPVPPIYQPEVAAEAVVWASRHNRREVWVGGSTVATLLLNNLAPGALDRYLAQNGYRAQLTDRPDDPDRPNNLFRPVDADKDHGGHGSFDERSKGSSLQFKASANRAWLGLGALALVAAAKAGRRR